MERSYSFAEEPARYLADSVEFLFPFSHLDLYAPSGSDQDVLDPRLQNNKTDFQKQNIRDFVLTDTFMSRGYVRIGDWTGPFLRLSYRGDPDSLLSKQSGGKLSSFIYAYLNVQGKDGGLIKAPYNEQTSRYEVEIIGYPGQDLYNQVSDKGKNALDKGWLLSRPDLIQGQLGDFGREGLDGRDMYQVAPQHTMHPILPLKIELAWTDHTKTWWDSQDGKNYHYAFDMLLRGWNNFMEVGVSSNPHGGVGFLHYRNLLSDYKSWSDHSELDRPVMPWMFNAFGDKGASCGGQVEPFMAVNYMDLHILKGNCGIGIHRHRDNQEIFFLLTGKAYMMVGDWYKFPGRERAFEIRTLLPGSFTLLKAGQLHSLMNALDIDATLLMFGGYD